MNEVKRLIFKVEGLKKNYGSFEALNIKKLEIHPGTIYAIVGPPGSGKGTQAEFIINKLNLVHISTGDIFRKNISKNT